MKLQKKNLLAQKRRWRIRKTVRGTAARPRLALKMTHVHLYAQAIDDDKGVTLVSLASTSKDLRGQKLKANVGGAATFGTAFGAKAKAAGLTTVVFDRAGRRMSAQANLTAFSTRFNFEETYGPDDRLSRKIHPGGILDYSDVFFNKRLGVNLNVSESMAYSANARTTTTYGPR